MDLQEHMIINYKKRYLPENASYSCDVLSRWNYDAISAYNHRDLGMKEEGSVIIRSAYDDASQNNYDDIVPIEDDETSPRG